MREDPGGLFQHPAPCGRAVLLSKAGLIMEPPGSDGLFRRLFSRIGTIPEFGILSFLAADGRNERRGLAMAPIGIQWGAADECATAFRLKAEASEEHAAKSFP